MVVLPTLQKIKSNFGRGKETEKKKPPEVNADLKKLAKKIRKEWEDIKF